MKTERWNQIEKLFHDARQLTGQDRSRYLGKMCGSDVAMRRQIERMLDQDVAEDFLDAPAVEMMNFSLAAGTLLGPLSDPRISWGRRYGRSLPRPRHSRFEPGDCAFPLGSWATGLRIECGWLVVPEQRSRPDGRTLRLAVGILRSQNPLPRLNPGFVRP